MELLFCHWFSICVSFVDCYSPCNWSVPSMPDTHPLLMKSANPTLAIVTLRGRDVHCPLFRILQEAFHIAPQMGHHSQQFVTSRRSNAISDRQPCAITPHGSQGCFFHTHLPLSIIGHSYAWGLGGVCRMKRSITYFWGIQIRFSINMEWSNGYPCEGCVVWIIAPNTKWWQNKQSHC